MEKKKVTLKDIIIQKGTIQSDVTVIDGKIINLKPIPHQNIEQYITHRDCDDCGIEFEKHYTYQRYCDNCQSKINKEKYFKLDLVEWNGEDALNLYNEETYFFNEEDILEFCKENEIDLKDLHLVLCYRTYFYPIDWETIEQDSTHEDWEPSDEFKAKVKEFNEFLVKQSTNTWMPSNKRVDIIKYLKS